MVSVNRIHIHAPKGHYIGQVRLRGHQKWQTVTIECQNPEQAMSCAVLFMTSNHKRARVLFVVDWYEPNVVMECSR